jgi:hypothetical protein
MLNKLPGAQSMPQSFIAIDASTNSLAFSMFQGKELLRYGKVDFVGSNPYYKAGAAAKRSVPFFKSYTVDAIVVEAAIFSNSPKTAMALSLVQGAVISAGQVAGIDRIETVSPITWQSFIGNPLLKPIEKKKIKTDNPGHVASWYKNKHRMMRKQRTIDLVCDRYGLELTDNDITDAIGIGWYVSENMRAVFSG